MKGWPASSKRDRSYSCDCENSWPHASCVGYFPEPRIEKTQCHTADHNRLTSYLNLSYTILLFRNSWHWMTRLKSQEPSSLLLSWNSLCWWPHTWIAWSTAQDLLWCSVMEVTMICNWGAKSCSAKWQSWSIWETELWSFRTSVFLNAAKTMVRWQFGHTRIYQKKCQKWILNLKSFSALRRRHRISAQVLCTLGLCVDPWSASELQLRHLKSNAQGAQLESSKLGI